MEAVVDKHGCYPTTGGLEVGQVVECAGVNYVVYHLDLERAISSGWPYITCTPLHPPYANKAYLIITRDMKKALLKWKLRQ